MDALQKFRNEKDEFFKTSHQSPLTAGQRTEFQALEYFPADPAWQLELELERNPQPEQVLFATSTGDDRPYWLIGQVRFEVQGHLVCLQVYEDDYGFFIPFVDATAPQETYPGGRYLEPHEIRQPRGVFPLDPGVD